MHTNLKNFILRLFPYVIAIIIGLIIFLIVHKIEYRDADVSNLLINISSDLLSIPFVFICYEVVNNFINRDLNNILFKSTTFDINSIIINIINDIRINLGFKDTINKDNLEDFLLLNKENIQDYLNNENNLNKDILDKMLKNSDNLKEIIRKTSTIQVLTPDQIKNLLYLSKEIEISHTKLVKLTDTAISDTDKKFLSLIFANIIESIRNWLENFEVDAIINHQNMNLL